MAKKKIAYIQFPGSNTENETKNILQKHGMLPFGHFWNDPSELLNNFDGFIILGGFSFEDRSRSGIIASLEPVVNELKKQAVLGKPVLGICNGAQILVESGLVPGNKEFDTLVSLTDNKRMVGGRIVGTGYFNKWCYIKPCENVKSAFIKKDGKPMRVPIAHAEGRFLFNDDLGAEILKNNLITYKYCDSKGGLSDDFPTNPNGSLHNAAALSNPTGNVMAIMPHPERTLKNEADDLFDSMKNYIESDSPFSYKALNFKSKKIAIQ
ncbi:MAG: phosphoribosylformylglycinamidine synthase I, partial [Flavobacteriia bacterium]|nr:phosphoribosylformylglycinamidine synthase I [Flavobacteriia bacterium]